MRGCARALALLSAYAYADDPNEYSVERTSGSYVTTNLVDLTTSGIKWDMQHKSVFDEDTGYHWLQIIHTVEADIASTDEVSFELSFTSAGDPWTDRKNIIAEDSGMCSISISSSDSRFWVQTATDQYYQCADQACSTINAAATTDSTIDWEVFGLDDDADEPFCSSHSDSDNFKCKKIKCQYRR